MSDLSTDLQNASDAIQAAQATVASQEPTLADNVLAAVTPVLESNGWSAPAELPADDGAVTVPVTTDPSPEQ